MISKKRYVCSCCEEQINPGQEFIVREGEIIHKTCDDQIFEREIENTIEQLKIF